MLPKNHIILTILFSIVLFIFNIPIFYIFLFFLAAVFIDVDHYMFYTKRKKDFSLSRAYYWHKNLPQHHLPTMHVFHTLEFLLIVGILSLFSKVILFIFLGFIYHSLLDILEMIYHKQLDTREFSLIRYLVSNKKNYL